MTLILTVGVGLMIPCIVLLLRAAYGNALRWRLAKKHIEDLEFVVGKMHADLKPRIEALEKPAATEPRKRLTQTDITA